MSPKFSIIVPLYNKAPYVRKALESILAQTVNDFELIIVDDGSTDNSAAICDEYLKEKFETINLKLEIRLLRQPNSGVAAARNNGVKASHGEYVCFLDADDWWEPDFLAEIDKLIQEYPEAGIYCTNYVYYKPGKTHVALILERGYMNYPKAYMHSEAMPVWTGATCLPRKVFAEIGGFPLGIKLGEDFLLWAKTALYYKVVFSEKPLAYYNNDVPASLRATRNLHAPEYSMYFHFDEIEEELSAKSQEDRGAWTQLLDKLRLNGLMAYWLSDEYHDAAAIELAKVDWSKQSIKVKKQYEKPIWLLRGKRWTKRVGSYCKQEIVKLFHA